MTDKENNTEFFRIHYIQTALPLDMEFDVNHVTHNMYHVDVGLYEANEALQGFWVDGSMPPKHVSKVYSAFGCLECPKKAKFYIPGHKIEYIEKVSA
jgi:hypothetical protein